jgi:8-oxo-dGTP diphosphatase
MSLSILSDFPIRAVKAIIYRNDGCVLLQQRDFAPTLTFSGCWTFAGGQVQRDEGLKDAMQRKLIEEFGCVPGRLGDELFQWAWRGDNPIQNHYFPVQCEFNDDTFQLNERLAMSWFPFEQLVALQLMPDIYENISKIYKLLKKYSKNLISSFERNILLYNDLRKKNDRVFYVNKNPCALSKQQIFLLKELASIKEIPVFRCCLHENDQCLVHEMIMVHTKPTVVGAHKQLKASLSYRMLEGELTVKLYDANGVFEKQYFLDSHSNDWANFISVRLNANEYRSIRSTSPFTIFFEVASGPFNDNDTIWIRNEEGANE